MTKMSDLQTPYFPNWCPGCGNLNVWGSFKEAAVQEGWDNYNTAIVAGIGCHGHMTNFIKITSFEGLHGRAIPVAAGIKMVNNRLNVFVFTGDGDCFGEGGNHFIHACRRNHDLTVLVHDNALYALTTGQTSPLTAHGFKTKSTPQGNPDEPFNPLVLAIASGATFVARAYSGNMPKLSELIIQANNHKGLAVIDILQPCITFNKICTHEFYQNNVYYLAKEYDPSDKQKALEKAMEFGPKKIPLGIFYKVDRPTYESQIPQIKKKPLVETPPVRPAVTELFKKYA
jgi:2-oxoglutarate ferredoxin oxidoreductase subunit beta